MINRTHKLSVARQAKRLGVSRSSVYYLPRPTSDGDLALMRRILELHWTYPYAGSRMLQWPRQKGFLSDITSPC
jgi:putative transposase